MSMRTHVLPQMTFYYELKRDVACDSALIEPSLEATLRCRPVLMLTNNSANN